ncbi:MAG: M48 family metalloprotease [Candidatus Aenigmatarchaeota archaeon]
MYYVGYINAIVLILLVIFSNFILWLISPKISDFIYRYFFKAEWISLDDLRKRTKSTAEFIESTCKKHNFNVPKLGIIADKNPNAFTYGSGRWNARIIITEGIFNYLNEKNIMAVYGHELGHIKNRDFIIMTIASAIIQLLYVFYVIGTKSRESNKSKRSYHFILGIISYIFYWIGQYIALYLSRIREYYADQFSAEETGNPNYLSVALIKIAYGILTNPDDVNLINTTRNIGIMDFSAAKSIGLTYYMMHRLKDSSIIYKAFLYDLNNPWALISELKSSHPLTGKRIKRLSTLCKNPIFDFKKIESKYPIDKGRLYSNFLKDLTVLALPTAIAIGFPLVYLYSSLVGLITFHMLRFISLWLILIGLSMVINTIYRYPNKKPEGLTILDAMSDIYASPVRGRRIVLEGKFVGRGIPGFIFSEDLMMQDSTGLIYLNYQSWIPLLGNLFFAINKVKQLIGKKATVDGWFLRGISSRIDLSSMTSADKKIKSYIKEIGIFWALVLIALGAFLALL